MGTENETNGARAGQPQGPAPTALPSAARAEFLALRSGLAIRQYVIEEVIGAGGFGITYRARHERLRNKVFALKEYFPREYANRSGTLVVSAPGGDGIFRWGLDRFLKEAEALARCTHASIVEVVDYFEENGTAYAVLGYVEGQQLGQWLDSLGRPPTQAEIDRLLMPLLDALEVVHGAGLLHLDLAPDNILVRAKGAPCLIDFGACREDIKGRTGKVSAIVKHGYSPPEQYHGLAELQGPWTDIYALGATLYRAVSGAPPMDSARRGALGDSLEPMARMARTDYRAGFMGAIDKALCLKPEERPQSVGQWRTMLMAEGGAAAKPPPAGTSAGPPGPGQQPVVTPPAPPPPPPQPGPIRRPWVIAGAALALLAGMGALALWRSPEPPRSDNGQKKISNVTGPGIATKPGPSGQNVTAPPVGDEPKKTAVEIPRPDPEREAAIAWARIGATADSAEIERFLAVHGRTAAGEQARARLAVLGLEAGRVRERDADFGACERSQDDAARIAACTKVVDGDDTPARRATALHLRGVAERKLGNHDRAIADLGASLGLVPGRADVHNDRGIAHFLKGDAEAAIRDYAAAISLDPRNAEALNNRAWALFRAGRAADGLPDANRAAEIAPDKAYVFDTRGHINEALGRRDDAIRDYERALAIDAGQADSRAGLARLRIRR